MRGTTFPALTCADKKCKTANPSASALEIAFAAVSVFSLAGLIVTLVVVGLDDDGPRLFGRPRRLVL